MYHKIIAAFLIYSYFFCSLGNTCYRTNSFGIKELNLVPLFTEGLYGPIRTIFRLFFYDWYAFINYILFLLTSLSNIFGALLFVYYMNKICEINLKSNNL